MEGAQLRGRQIDFRPQARPLAQLQNRLVRNRSLLLLFDADLCILHSLQLLGILDTAIVARLLNLIHLLYAAVEMLQRGPELQRVTKYDDHGEVPREWHREPGIRSLLQQSLL